MLKGLKTSFGPEPSLAPVVWGKTHTDWETNMDRSVELSHKWSLDSCGKHPREWHIVYSKREKKALCCVISLWCFMCLCVEIPDLAAGCQAAEAACARQERRALWSWAGFSWILMNSGAGRSGWWDQKPPQLKPPSPPDTLWISVHGDPSARRANSGHTQRLVIIYCICLVPGKWNHIECEDYFLQGRNLWWFIIHIM